MAYRVEFRPRAEQDLETLFRHLVQEAPLHGPRWVSALEDAIYTLRELPESAAPSCVNCDDPGLPCDSFCRAGIRTSTGSTSPSSPPPFGFSTFATARAGDQEAANSSNELEQPTSPLLPCGVGLWPAPLSAASQARIPVHATSVAFADPQCLRMFIPGCGAGGSACFFPLLLLTGHWTSARFSI